MEIRQTQRRGAQLLDASELRRRVQESGDRLESKRKQAAVPRPNFGGMLLRHTASLENVLIAGKQGVGKTTIADVLSASLLRGYVGPGKRHRAILHDHKGDSIAFMSELGFTFENGLLHTFNPFHPKGCRWAMGRDVTDTLSAGQFVEILMPTNPHSSEPYFEDMARAVLKGIIASFQTRLPGTWSFRDILQAAVFESFEDLQLILSWHPDNERFRHLFKKGAEKMLLGVQGKLQSGLEPYIGIASLWQRASSETSVVEFLRGSSVLLLGSYPRAQKQLAALNRIFLSRLIDELLTAGPAWKEDATNPYRTYFILDEGPKIGKLDQLHDLLDLGRQRGASVIFTFHDIPQLKDVYGDLTDSILGKFGNKAILRLDDPVTQRWASELFGSHEVLETKSSSSSSRSFHTGDFRPTGTFDQETESSQTAHEIREYQLLLPSQLAEIPVPLDAGGIAAYYKVDSGNAYSVFPWSQIASARPEPRPLKGDQWTDLRSVQFTKWTESERRRLGLSAQ